MSDAPSSPNGASFFGVTVEEVNHVSRHLASLMTTGRYSIGFAIELALHASKRYYDIYSIYKEIAILEGSSNLRSTTKPATPFRREPLTGYYHKHHQQNVYLLNNMIFGWKRNDQIGKIITNYVGHNIDDIVNQLTHDLTFSIVSERSQSGEMTGEFLAFEKMSDGSNYYIALGSHKQDHITKAKIDLFKSIDEENFKNRKNVNC